MKKLLLTALVASMLSACVTNPVPPGYGGPVVTVQDGVIPRGNARAEFFIVLAIDGNNVNNALSESRNASNGKGYTLVAKGFSRPLPARPMKVKLLATEETGAPIHAIFRDIAGRSLPSAVGEVDFVPKEGDEYAVVGEMSKSGSSVWIKDLTTDLPATDKVTSAK